MGIDYSLNLNKLHLATLYINELNAKLIVTNPDHFTYVQGRRFPGNGCLVQALLLTTGLKQSEFGKEGEPGTYDLIGKPNPYALRLVQKDHNLDASSRTVMIGDNPKTDVMFGKNGGVDQCLVLSGVVKSMEDFEQNWKDKDGQANTPTHVMELVGRFKDS